MPLRNSVLFWGVANIGLLGFPFATVRSRSGTRVVGTASCCCVVPDPNYLNMNLLL